VPSFLTDENFDNAILDGVRRRDSTLDIVRVQDVGLMRANDPTILEWAAAQGRILLTHDEATAPNFAYERVGAGLPMPGVVVVPWLTPIGAAIEELLLFAACSHEGEWEGRVIHLPL
jgi:Domain of unknown function (DUF5615)